MRRICDNVGARCLTPRANFDDAIVSALVNQDWAKVRTLQKSFNPKKIVLKVVGGGELDAKAHEFSIVGVFDVMAYDLIRAGARRPLSANSGT